MKKIYIFFIISFFFGINSSEASACGSDEQCYQENIQYDYNQDFETICYSNYYYNNRFYKLYMPCSRQEFIRLEFAVASGEIVDKNNYWFKLVFLNALLINKGLEPLYY